jgi:putative membrane protein
MFVRKSLTLSAIWHFSGMHIVWLTAWATFVAFLYEVLGATWLSIPWLPLSIIATAVAFYVGFKNSQAYGRLWEARKIWGGLVNGSRAWGSQTTSFISNLFRDTPLSDTQLKDIQKSLIYRHIAYLYVHRAQLLNPEQWEHINQNKYIARLTKKRQAKYGVGLLDDAVTKETLGRMLSEEELDLVKNSRNAATQLMERQSLALKSLREKDLIDDFRHMEMQRSINEFYALQGKNERIKKFPFPRQYGGMSSVFIGIFIFLAPFGLVTEFAKLGELGVWLSIPFTVIVTWVYLVMELVGDYSENPFEGMGNDIPMMSLCRTIEIDLLEMIGEESLPDPIQAKNDVLL